jgi:hypothetical protein
MRLDLSRRDFLKLAAAGTLGMALAELGFGRAALAPSSRSRAAAR